MPLTRDDLANRALSKLMADGGAGQSPEAEDTAKADSAIDGMVAYLEETNVYSVPDLDDINAAAFDSLALYLAGEICTDFGKTLADGETMRNVAVAKLTLLTATRPSREPLAVDYF
jgi:hypothetical protein